MGVVTLITCKITAERCLGSITTVLLKSKVPMLERNDNKSGEIKTMITLLTL